METFELKLKNYNNCLNCEAFVYISFAPKKEITEADLARIYYTENGADKFYSRIVDFQRFEFLRMPSIATFPAVGMEANEWRQWWLEQYPQTKMDDVMAVYYYKKVEI